jgi:hypothetical protein
MFLKGQYNEQSLHSSLETLSVSTFNSSGDNQVKVWALKLFLN